MDTAPLKAAGLTEGEIKVYLALLELGSATTGPIIERSSIAKSIVYQVLEKLMQKGIVSVIQREQIRHFQASDPHKLLDYLEERKRQLEANKEALQQLIPELLLKQAMAAKSETRMYFGTRGMTTAHEHLYEKLKRGDEYFYLGVPAYQPEPHHLYWQRDHERRVEAGIRVKLLFNADTDKRIIAQRNTYRFCEAKLMSQKIQTPAMTAIFGDTVLIIVQSPEVITVEIINEHVARSFSNYFQEFWQSAESVHMAAGDRQTKPASDR